MTHGFKRNILPDHCGKCVFLDWEEQSCACSHPAFIDNDELLEHLQNELENGSYVEVIAAARELHGMRLDDADWHGYDSICDLYVKQRSRKEDDEVIGSENTRYEERALRLWHDHKANKE